LKQLWRKSNPRPWLIIGYVLLIVYGSLYPFAGWHWPEGGLWQIFACPWPEDKSRSDLLVNILVYAPLGMLVTRRFAARTGGFRRILWATLAGGCLSFTLEVLQQFLPSRTSGLSDVAMNLVGSFGGAALGLITAGYAIPARRIRVAYERYFLSDSRSNFGLLVLAFWTFSQWVPFVPSADWGDLKHGLKPLWITLQDLSLFDFLGALAYVFQFTGLATISLLLGRDRSHALLLFGIFAATVLVFKIPIEGRQVSLEALTGLFGGALLAALGSVRGGRFAAWLGGFAVLIGFWISQLRPGSGTTVGAAFNWIPFRGNLQVPGLMGLSGIFEILWQFAALAFFANCWRLEKRMVYLTGMGVLVSAFITEWLQQFIPGRYPDITTVLLAAVAWGLNGNWGGKMGTSMFS